MHRGVYPFPAFSRFCAETPVAQESKLPVDSALNVQHLDARKVRVQNRHCGIEDLLEQRLRPPGGDQSSCDLVKTLGSVKLYCEALLALYPCRAGGYSLS